MPKKSIQWPLLWLAIFLALGILAAHAVSLPISCLLGSGFALAFAALAWPRSRLWLLPVLLLLVGAANYTLRTAIIAPHDLRTLLVVEPQEAVVRGALVDTPYQRVFNRDGSERWRTLARIKLEAIALDQQWIPTIGELIVTTPDLLANHFYRGQRVQVAGVIHQPPNARAPGLFDYRRYLRTVGIHYQLRVSSTNDWQLLSAATKLPLAARFDPWAREVLARGLPRDRYVELLWAMTLGWKTALNGEVSEPFMRSGTMHVFAISGLHITLIAAILVATLKLFRLRRATCATIVIPLIWFYTGATGWQASAIRSTIMSSVIILGWCLKRPSNLLNSLMAAGFLILLWDPLQLFQAGFQLSFFVVLALALLTPALDKLRQRWLAPDPFLAPGLRTRAWRWCNKGAHWITASFAVSLAAWLGSLPLIANYFHLFTPITLLANMIVVPLSSGALACNMATLAIGGLWPGAAELFNHCAWFLMLLMVRVSEWAASLPHTVFHVKSPGLIDVAVYYALLIAVFSGWLLRADPRRWLAGGLTAAIPFTGWWEGETKSQMTILPGPAVYVRHEDEWLIDCGDSNSGRHITRPFLQAEGINRLPHLVLTHGDVRHVEAAPAIHETFSSPKLYASPIRFRSVYYRRVQERFRTNGVPLYTILAGDRLGMWEVLHPADDTNFPQADDNAVVLLGEIFGNRVLLLSDLGLAGQNALLNRCPGLRADIIVTGLPRESEPVADGFLDVIQPKTIIIADSEQERTPERLRNRLAQRDIQVIYTSDSAAVTFTFSKGDRTIRTMNH